MAKAQRTYSAEKKAQVQLEIAIGQITKCASLADVAEKHGIPRATIQTWWEEARDQIPGSIADLQEESFGNALQDAARAMVRAHIAALRPIEDENWLKTKYNQPNGEQEVSKLIVTLSNSLLAIGRATGAVEGAASALPARGDTELVDCEIVDA